MSPVSEHQLDDDLARSQKVLEASIRVDAAKAAVAEAMADAERGAPIGGEQALDLARELSAALFELNSRVMRLGIV